MKRVAFLLLCIFLFARMQGQEFSDFIHVDQFGYTPESAKVAVLSNPQMGYNSSQNYTPSSTLEIRNATTNELVSIKSPVIWNNGNTQISSGDQGWWLDFSDITEEGTYYIFDVANNERSSNFNISANVYSNVLKAAGRMFYYNRCNMGKEEPFAQGWSDGDNFPQDIAAKYIYDPGNDALEKDLSGGWFDAGDYNKYVTFASSALHDLLWAYEENPDAFNDDWNIPESNNGVPDIIDEIKWEIDWLLKMNNADGSTHIKMGSQNFTDNTESPPSANTNDRFYGPTCSSASIAVAGVFAHAALVFSEINGLEAYSATLEQRAITSYNFSKSFIDTNTLETGCDDGSIVAGDADRNITEQKNEFLAASVYLLALTEEESYNDYIIANVLDTEPLTTNFWGVYTGILNDALGMYIGLSNSNTAISTAIENSLNIAVAQNSNNYFGFSNLDLYRAYMPEWSYHWGSNLPKASYGNLNNLITKLDIIPSQSAEFQNYVDETIHYFHGVNPQGIVYLSNMYEDGAEKSVNQIYHTWFADGTIYDDALTSVIGPAPGFLAGGPNNSFTVSALLPPYGQPDQKSFLDFNDGFPNNSWEITEPAIYYQAGYLRLLSKRVVDGQVLGNNEVSMKLKKHQIYPNPSAGVVHVTELLKGDKIYIYTSDMKKIESIVVDETKTIDVTKYNQGLYFLKIISSEKTSTVKLIVK